MPNFGSPTPALFGNAASVPTFPQTGGTYTHPTLPITVPGGALDHWWAYRASRGALRGEVVGIGDSTMYGSGALYSFLQRLRDRSTAYGIADGGKGMFAAGEGELLYDAPEINGLASASNFGGNPDGYDNTDGQFYYDDGAAGAGHTLTLQFRTTAARLWYVGRATAGDFTYSVDGGAPITVQAWQASAFNITFVYLSGLTANATHTVTITNLATSTNGGGAGAKACYVAFAPMNATGLAWQKYATSGDTINARFFGQTATPPYTQLTDGLRYRSAFGLTPTSTVGPTYRGAVTDTTAPLAGRAKPVLALTNLGFNDLTSAASSDLPMWTEYVKRFAGTCYDAGCDGIVLSGQLPYNAQWPTYGAARYNAIKAEAANQGLVWIDLFYPVGGGPSLSYSGGVQNPHLTKTQYQAQADFIWDNLLGL